MHESHLNPYGKTMIHSLQEIRSNGVDIEKILLSMEIEALTQVSMKTVVNEFSSSGRDVSMSFHAHDAGRAVTRNLCSLRQSGARGNFWKGTRNNDYYEFYSFCISYKFRICIPDIS